MNIECNDEISNFIKHKEKGGKNYFAVKLQDVINSTNEYKEILQNERLNCQFIIVEESKEFSINNVDYIKKIVFILFQKYINDKNIQQQSIEKKKLLINKFEKVVKSIRYKVLDDKTIFQQIDDDLELLMQLSEVHSISDCLEELIDEYLNMYNKRYLVICLYKESGVSEDE